MLIPQLNEFKTSFVHIVPLHIFQ